MGRSTKKTKSHKTDKNDEEIGFSKEQNVDKTLVSPQSNNHNMKDVQKKKGSSDSKAFKELSSGDSASEESSEEESEHEPVASKRRGAGAFRFTKLSSSSGNSSDGSSDNEEEEEDSSMSESDTETDDFLKYGRKESLSNEEDSENENQQQRGQREVNNANIVTSRLPNKCEKEDYVTRQQLPKAKAKAKTAAKKIDNNDDDFDALLDSLKPVAKPLTKTSEKPKQIIKAAENKEASSKNDDFDSLLAQFSEPSSATSLAEPQKVLPKVSSPAPSSSIVAEASALDIEEGGEANKLSKSAKKKQKKKAAAMATNEKANVETSTPSLPQSKAKAVPLSAAARLAQQRLQLLKEEKAREEEEERKRHELELKRQQEEEEKNIREQEEKEKQKRLKQERKERLKREGKLLSAAAKERAKKTQIARAQLLQHMNIEAVSLERDEPAVVAAGGKRSKAIQDRKKPKAKKQPLQETMPSQNIVESISASKDFSSSETLEQQEQEDVETKEFGQKETVTRDNVDEDEESVASSWDKGSSDDEQEIDQQGDNKKTSMEHIASAKTSSKGTLPTSLNQESTTDMTNNVVSIPAKEITPSIASSKKHDNSEVSNKKKLVAQQRAALELAELRSPICCILGHVDTGKTKLLDKIRRTNVQGDEAGGITQQIGATFFPHEALRDQCHKVDPDLNMRVPGLLIIDTPGHESFNNLRARGSSLCDIAILVVDIMHGLEPQTRESLDLLRGRKCPFIVALNKIDRLYGWVAAEWSPARPMIEKQVESTRDEFDKRCESVLLQLTECGLNCSLWWKVSDVKTTVSIAPTSAMTGEGIPDLLYLLVRLTQTVITRALVFREEFQCTILEVKAVEGLGTTIDVILVSGTLYENDKIVVCGMSGPIVTTIRALLTPQPLRELRVKGEYTHHKEIRAAMGVKISAHGLEEAVAGTSLLVARNKDEEGLERLQEEVMSDMATIFDSVDRSGIGVYVMASTLGSLEALLQFLKTSNIPVFAVNLGTVNKIDVKKASIVREKGRPDLCCILAFDIKVDPEAMKEAQTLGVKIFTADIIYHLFDNFNKHVADCAAATKREKSAEVVFPCILSIYPNFIFNKKDPIVLGVKVEDGLVKVGTPLCIPEKNKLVIGKIVSLEHNKKTVEQAKKGDDIAIKIVGDTSITVGRHFDHTHKLYSKMTRESIDCLKAYFRDELSKDDWKVVRDVKKTLGII